MATGVGFIAGLRFLLKNLIFPWRVARFVERIGEADGVFLVHMGVPEHKREIAPAWMLRILRRFVSTALVFVGEYPRGASGIRLIALSPLDMLDTFSRKDFRGIVDNAIRIQKGVGAQKVILGGLLPHYVRRHYRRNIPDVIEMDNFRGPVFALTAAVQSKSEEFSLQQERDWICVVGVGTVGSRLVTRLQERGFKVFALDPRSRIEISDTLVRTNNPALLESYAIKLFIVTTRLGSDIRKTVRFFPQGALLINEAYPGVFAFPEVMGQLTEKNIAIEQLSLISEGIRPSRALWGFGEDEIPACVVRFLVDLVEPQEASVQAAEDIHDRIERVATGSRLGLRPKLTRW